MNLNLALKQGLQIFSLITYIKHVLVEGLLMVIMKKKNVCRRKTDSMFIWTPGNCVKTHLKHCKPGKQVAIICMIV